MASKSSSRPTPSPYSYPPPMIFEPLSPDRHTHTIILLHGRGSHAAKFAPPLLSTLLPSISLTIQQRLPKVKFVFPTSSFRRATFANRAVITQWFDNATLTDVDKRPEVQIRGLRESVHFLHGLIEREAEVLSGDCRRVMIGGLSQGACVALLAGLLWEGTCQDENDGNKNPSRLGAVFGFAGRLPLRSVLEEAMELAQEGAEVDSADAGADIIFGDDDGDDDNHNNVMEKNLDKVTGQGSITPAASALEALRDELGFSFPLPTCHSTSTKTRDPSIIQTPVFLGHGTQDEVVPIEVGRQAFRCMQRIECVNLVWHEYDDLGHWYHGRELEDLVNFLVNNVDGLE